MPLFSLFKICNPHFQQVLTGAGDFYSSGNDLTNFMMVDLTDKNAVESLMRQSKSMMIEYIDSFIKFPKILIACVNGMYWYFNNSDQN